MAMISCPECNQSISDQAYACPHCGYPVKKAPASPFKISLRYNVSNSCPAATFIKVMSVIMLIGGLILAIASSYQQQVRTNYYGSVYYKEVFVWENFFTVFLTYVIYAVFGLILAKVVRQVDAVHMQLSTLKMITSSGEETQKAPEKKVSFWICPVCKAQNGSENAFCKGCGKVKEDVRYPQHTSSWACECCGAMNENSNTYCLTCHASKPAQKKTQRRLIGSNEEAFGSHDSF